MNRENYSISGAVYVLVAIVSWGVYFPLAKIVLLKLSPEVFLVFRLGLGTAVLFVLHGWLGKSHPGKLQSLGKIILAGAAGVMLHQLIQTSGLKITSATNSGWIITLSPAFTGALGWIILKEKVRLRQMLGMGIALLGVLLLISKGKVWQLSFGRNLGDFLVLASAVTWSIYTVMNRPLLQRNSAILVSAIQMGMGFLFFTILAGNKILSQSQTLTSVDWILLASIGIVPSGLAYFWWNAGLARLTAVRTSIFLFIEAVIASIMSVIILGESFTILMLIAAVITIAGVTIAQTVSGYKSDSAVYNRSKS
ncbi:MAG: DMT family transporter [candidate division Zixibacteria bacterium]|nr:DMT family transporter [candidate division Zixibacteria bacterium]